MSLADEYARQAAFRSWDAAFDRLPLRPGDHVLDLGCGVGTPARLLAARGARVTAIDADPALLAAAEPCADVTYRQADLATWDEPALGADGLWSSFTAAYFPDFLPVLRRWTHALAPGGWVALVEVEDLFGHRPLPVVTRGRLKAFVAEALAAGRHDFTAGRMLAARVRAAGLDLVQEADLPDEELAAHGAASAAVLAAWAARLDRMRGLQAYLGADFPAVRAELLAALADPAHMADARVRFVLARKARARSW